MSHRQKCQAAWGGTGGWGGGRPLKGKAEGLGQPQAIRPDPRMGCVMSPRPDPQDRGKGLASRTLKPIQPRLCCRQCGPSLCGTREPGQGSSALCTRLGDPELALHLLLWGSQPWRFWPSTGCFRAFLKCVETEVLGPRKWEYGEEGGGEGLWGPQEEGAGHTPSRTSKLLPWGCEICRGLGQGGPWWGEVLLPPGL